MVLWKQRTFKYCRVVEVKFLGLGPIGPFSYEKRFPESSAKSLKIPPPSTKHKKWRPGTSDWQLGVVLGFQKV